MVRICIMSFRPFVLYGDVGYIRVCIVAANGHTCVCVLLKWGVSNL
jgi:hypothetical protein